MSDIIVAGHGGWCLNSIKYLLKKNFLIKLVIGRYTNEDYEIKIFCKSNKINYKIYKNINNPNIVRQLSNYNSNLFISISYDQILGLKIINSFKNIINFHAGDLPNYRGRSVVNWALINGEKKIGLTVHKLDKNIDTGDIILKKYINISINDNYLSVLSKIYSVTPILIFKSIKLLKKDNFKSIKQSQTGIKAKYYRHRKQNDEVLKRLLTRRDAHNFIRALTYPGPYATVLYHNKIIYIINSIYQKDLKNNGIRQFIGKFIYIQNNHFFLKCIDGYLRINILIHENK